MLAPITIKKYIQRCEDILKTNDKNGALNLEEEIISVLEYELPHLSTGLSIHDPGAYGEVNNNIRVITDRLHSLNDIKIIRGRLEIELDKAESNERFSNNGKRPHKIFISHSSKDKEYVEAIIGLLESVGLTEGQIICSSIPPYNIPLDRDIYDWLVSEFRYSDLHVFFILSSNYYESVDSMNEMGASWAMKNEWTGFLLPGFDFSQIKGCINKSQICIKLDNQDNQILDQLLLELRENLISEFNLYGISEALWNRKKNEFLDKISSISQSKTKNTVDNRLIQKVAFRNVNTPTADFVIPPDQALLLVYAANNDGQIIYSITHSGIQISTGGKEFVSNQSPREIARWKDVLQNLVVNKLIETVGLSGQIYSVTNIGYKYADMLMEGMGIDINKDPLQQLKEFE